MKNFMTTLLLLVVAISCFSCGNRKVTARDVYEQFRNHYDNQDFEAMAEMLSSSCKERLEKIYSSSVADALQEKIDAEQATLHRALTIPETELGKILENRMFEKEGSGQIGFMFNTGRYIWKLGYNRDTEKWLISIP